MAHWKGRVTLNHLHRLWEHLPQHSRAQDLVRGDGTLESRDELIEPLTRGYGQQRWHHVRITAAFVQQMMEQQSFLQGHQRVDVLDVARTSRNRFYDLFELFRIQLHERQHLRSDGCAIRRNQIRWYLNLLAGQAGECGRKCRERWASENPTYFDGQARTTQPLHHLHYQQGVTAQLEKVVMAANALDS
jgi:hypothetical protein